MRFSSDVSLKTEAQKRGKGNMRSLRFLRTYLRPYGLQIMGALLALCLTSGGVLGIGWGVRYFVDHGISTGDMALLNQAVLVLLAIILFLAVATFSRYFLVTWIGEQVVADIRRDVYHHLLKQDVAFFETTRTGEVLSRLTTDTSLLQTVVGSSVSIALRNSVLLAGGITMLVITSPALSGYILVMVPLVVAPIIIIGRKVRMLSRLTQERVADISSHAEETISAIRTLQALAIEQAQQTRFDHYVADVLQTAKRRISLRAILTAIVITLVLGAVAMLLWLGGRDVIHGTMSGGELSSFVFYAVLVAGATGAISEVIGDLQRAAGATERLQELLATVPSIVAPAEPVALPERLHGAISFDNVSFSYPSRPDTLALNTIQLDVQAGETLALVGASGAGKSSFMQLLLRFYDVSAGSIRIDGVDLRQLDPLAWRARIGLVPQDPVIFSANGWDNIRMARPDATEADILHALEQAEALEFMRALPDGMNSYLGEKGVRLSGGQRQRLAIARALVRNPEILLLDEATSALDSENEHKVQKALERSMQGRTTLVIAHRLSTVQNADRIVVLDAGSIHAIGTHAELLAHNALYQRLARQQFESVA